MKSQTLHFVIINDTECLGWVVNTTNLDGPGFKSQFKNQLFCLIFFIISSFSPGKEDSSCHQTVPAASHVLYNYSLTLLSFDAAEMRCWQLIENKISKNVYGVQWACALSSTNYMWLAIWFVVISSDILLSIQTNKRVLILNYNLLRIEYRRAGTEWPMHFDLELYFVQPLSSFIQQPPYLEQSTVSCWQRCLQGHLVS